MPVEDTTTRWALLPLLLVAGLTIGCGSPATTFRPSTDGHLPEDVLTGRWDLVESHITSIFGTPDDPKIPEGVPLQIELVRQAAGPAKWTGEGKLDGLYRRLCASCHGLSGDGAGVAARLMDPYPRDFRKGWFKYHRSTSGWPLPTDEDLDQTIRQGNVNTGMPSFAWLPDAERKALIEYVKFLTLRGKTEGYLVREIIDDTNRGVSTDDAAEEAALAWKDWTEAVSQTVATAEPTYATTADRQAAIARGREVYQNEEAKCVECHGPEGRGDGESTELHDEWNKAKLTRARTAKRDPHELFRLPVQESRPRDFAEGAFRGGDQPIDLHRRIHVGIGGTVMPTAGPTSAGPGILTEAQIWDLVAYVLSRSGQ